MPDLIPYPATHPCPSMPHVWFYQISPEAMVISQEAKVTEVVNPATGLELFGVSLGQECHERK